MNSHLQSIEERLRLVKYDLDNIQVELDHHEQSDPDVYMLPLFRKLWVATVSSSICLERMLGEKNG